MAGCSRKAERGPRKVARSRPCSRTLSWMSWIASSSVAATGSCGTRMTVCHERTDERRCDAVQEMRVGPSEPAVRSRLQTTASCDGQEPWWCCVKKARERHAVREMKEDPSEPFCRGGLQTAMSCFGQKLR